MGGTGPSSQSGTSDGVSHPDQFWLGDTALTQVGSVDQVRSGTFYVDYGAHQIVLGQDPAGQSPRASDLRIAMTVSSANSVLRWGSACVASATSIAVMGSLRLGGSGDSIDNVVVSESATTGVSTSKPDHRTRGPT